MTLELATTLGAETGAFAAPRASREVLAILFAALLTCAGVAMVRKGFDREVAEPGKIEPYSVKRLPLGLLSSAGAGAVSGMIRVGGGPSKVPLMYLVMGVPF